jgi:hypothetical protein
MTLKKRITALEGVASQGHELPRVIQIWLVGMQGEPEYLGVRTDLHRRVKDFFDKEGQVVRTVPL